MGDARRTTAGTAYLASKQAAHEPAIFDRFMFAYIPGLDTDATPPADEDLPIVGHRKGTFPVTRSGYINPDQVVYSILLGTDVGDFPYNWIGLLADDDTLSGVVYVPETVKQKYDVLLGHRGNSITRNFLMVYDDLQGITEITIDAETWQIDFMQRLNASDEMQESLARALLGDGAVFLGNGLKIENASGFKLRAGRAVVHGMVLVLDADINASAAGAAAGKDIWLDVWRDGDLNGVVINVDVIADIPAAVHNSYTDGNGRPHIVVKTASIAAGGAVTDLRGSGGNLLLPTDDALSSLFAHAGRTDNPHEVTKAQVGLGNLPNAKSDTPADNSNVLATVKAVWLAFNSAISSLADHILDTDNPHGVTKAQVGLSALPNAKSDSISLNDSNVLATAAAVFALKQALLPAGVAQWFPSRAAIEGDWIPADGQLLARALVPRLVAKLGSLPVVTDVNWIGTPANRGSYSSGNGATTIRVPDYNGKYGTDVSVFLRGDGGNAAAAGIIQPSAVEAHTHSTPTSQGTHYTGAGPSQVGPSNNDGVTGSTGGNETRPVNVAGVWCIKL